MQGKWAFAVAWILTAATGSAEAGVRVGVGVHVSPTVRPRVVAASRPVVVRGPVLRVWGGPRIVVATGFGELKVEVEPDRARVFIDGKDQGKGDTTQTLRAGAHWVKVKLADGREASQTVHIDGGRRTTVRLELH